MKQKIRTALPAYSSGNRADCLPCLRQGSAVRIPLGHKASVWLICTQKKSSSVKITLLLKVDLEGFEPLTSRMRTERSPNSLAFVHTLCTMRKEKSTYIRPYKTTCHPNGLSWSQVWFPIRWFSKGSDLGCNMVGGQVSYRPLRYSSHGVQMYRIPIHNKIRCTVKAQLLLGKNESCAFMLTRFSI